ncbi:FixH family protein [Roseibium sp.]|uniref:FixH family protein n=1 Tax=Roseibium sp. TaxID=1936156 RepID=UPI003A96DCBF
MTTVERNGTPPDVKLLTGRRVLFWIIGFFAVIFSANGVFVYLALHSFPGVVVESSYKAGQAYNQELADARAQAERGWQVSASLTRVGGDAAMLRIEPKDYEGHVLAGLDFIAIMEHPAHKGDDVSLALSEVQSGVYQASATGVAGGNWELVLEARRGDQRLFRSENRLFLKNEDD